MQKKIKVDFIPLVAEHQHGLESANFGEQDVWIRMLQWEGSCCSVCLLAF